MDYSFGPAAQELEAQVREWLSAEMPADWAKRLVPGSNEWVRFQKQWDRKLYQRGWGALFWPTQYGGADASIEERVAFAKAMAEAGAPEGLGKSGKRLLAPVLIRHGTEQQRQTHLPPLLRGEAFWAQGFSEPEAGSDLASLRTRGVFDGDNLVVTGHKTWSSHAAYCGWLFMLVRTQIAARRQDGITFVLVRLDTPGIQVRPIPQINRLAQFAEIVFDEVRIPASGIVGTPGQGWTVAKALLDYERGAEMAFGRSTDAHASLRSLVSELRLAYADSDAERLTALGELQARYLSAELNALRILGAQLAGDEPGAMASVVKLQQSEDLRWGSSLQLRLLGQHAQRATADLYDRYLTSRMFTIASGTSEIQRDVIARRVLQLPQAK
jgi:alkylation response protein AidB-like acyl-CoA dehydrogenase